MKDSTRGGTQLRGRLQHGSQRSAADRRRRIFMTLVAMSAWLLIANAKQWLFVSPPTAENTRRPAPATKSGAEAAFAPTAPAELMPPGVRERLPGLAVFTAGLTAASSQVGAQADVFGDVNMADLTPETFRPVCPASDGLYNVLKGVGDVILGSEGQEYRPLVIEALLRVRLEVCVLESFVYEAIVPFVQKKGLGWILPLHETIDTVIAGTVFALAINFILFGTTKILAVLSIYHDFIVGAPLRLIGYGLLPEPRAPEPSPFIQINWPGQGPPPPAPEPEVQEEEQAQPKDELSVGPVQVFGGVCKTYGNISEFVKNTLEGFDTFVGRYLVVVSIAYVGFKWAHFRLFNDFFPF